MKRKPGTARAAAGTWAIGSAIEKFSMRPDTNTRSSSATCSPDYVEDRRLAHAEAFRRHDRLLQGNK